MDNGHPSTSIKRFSDGEEQHQQEHQVDNSPLDADISGIDLMEMDNNSLIELFQQLTLLDLLMVSEVCKMFQELACRAFSANWKDAEFTLRNVTVNDRLGSLRFLRQFGSVVRKLNIEFGDDRNEEFFYIILYKCLNLTEIKFSHRITDAEVQKRFLNKENFSQLNAKFQNLKIIHFDTSSAKLVNPNCIEQSFSNLEYCYYSSLNLFNDQHLRNFINCNRQVKNILLKHEGNNQITRNLMKFIDRKLFRVEELELTFNEYHRMVEYEPVFLKKIKRVIITDMTPWCLTGLYYLSNTNVEEAFFFFRCWDDTVIHLICTLKQLKSLKLLCFDMCLSGGSLRMLSKKLPNLTNIVLTIGDRTDCLDIGDIVQFVKKSKQLKEFKAQLYVWDLDQIKENFDPREWFVDRQNGNLIICKVDQIKD